MNISVGIIGLPNVGKSTLFNALLKKQQALAANYPFATIEPNVGIVPVPDARLEVLQKITAKEILKQVQDDSGNIGGELKLPPIKPAIVEFVDIAGLVKGASEGAGLGNKFLSHIREVKIIAHVVRAFEDPNVIREGSVDVMSDYQTIQTELMLADLQTIEKVNVKKHESGIKNYGEFIERLKSELNSGRSVRSLDFVEEEKEAIKELQLLSSKPEIIVLNVAEGEYSDQKNQETINKYAGLLSLNPENFARPQTPEHSDGGQVVVCAKVESELSELNEEEQLQYLKELGVEKSGLERLIQKAYEKLGLISFLTCGEIEVKAWTIKKGSSAVEASGEIHTDFMQKFIKAEVVSYEDFVENKGWKGSREKGKARMEGRDYIVSDGDVIEFKIGR